MGEPQVSLRRVIPVQVVAPGALVPGPVARTLLRKLKMLGPPWSPRGEHVPVPVRRGSIASRVLKPWVLSRGVVDGQVDQHAEAERVGYPNQPAEVVERAEPRVDCGVVADVVAVVVPWAGVQRLQP